MAVGTSVGAVGETAGFLENLIQGEGEHPKPTKFINSVHNAMATQIAIQFGFTGENIAARVLEMLGKKT